MDVIQEPLFKKELLVPAGDYDSFLAAIQNGADAVYLSGKQFGARAFAKNFEEQELEKVIQMGHLYGVKVYVTMNTMVKEKEVASFLREVNFLYERGVDAILMQDFGMICLCREMFKDLEIHASTQVNNSSQETISLLEKIGVKRVVFPREMSLDEIEQIKTTMEKEVFIHGALCVSYSGNCLLSFLGGGRSANRGACAGCCRLPYTLFVDQKRKRQGYLLSMKELHTAPSFSSLLKSDITSFKIEGRMKSASYVAAVTRYYRKLLDGEQPTKQDLEKIQILFYRGFTEGHLFQKKNLINESSPNHIGLPIGKVEKVTPKFLFLRLSHPLFQGDGIRFKESKKGMKVNYLYDEQRNLVSSIPAHSLALIENTLQIQTKDVLLKTSSITLDPSEEKRFLPVRIFIKAKVGFPFEIRIQDEDGNQAIRQGAIIEKARTCPTSLDKIKSLVLRLKDTPFYGKEVKLEVDDDIFLSVKEVTSLRREVVSDLMNQRMAVSLKRKNTKLSFQKRKIPNHREKINSVVTKKEEVLTQFLLQENTRIYVSDFNLYQKYQKEKAVFYVLPRNELHRKFQGDQVLSQELRKGKGSMIGGYSLNVANAYSAYYLVQYGFQSVFLSIELTFEEIEELLESVKKHFGYLPLEMVVEGHLDAMVIRGNLFHLKKEEKAFLKDSMGRVYPIQLEGENTILQSEKKIDRKKEIQDLFEKGVTAFCQIDP